MDFATTCYREFPHCIKQPFCYIPGVWPALRNWNARLQNSGKRRYKGVTRRRQGSFLGIGATQEPYKSSHNFMIRDVRIDLVHQNGQCSTQESYYQTSTSFFSLTKWRSGLSNIDWRSSLKLVLVSSVLGRSEILRTSYRSKSFR